ncbi:MAG: guanylate cyclase [Alphaproteobacteria bacterium RIFOXYD12_FULL_60_8]|nr:MAG: guanylate cyclase [Alphaproteobacteria bacterium RIFOXYD12_FULL_60_8]
MRRSTLLLKLSEKLATADNLDSVLKTLVELTTAEVGAERGSLFLNDEKTGELYSRVALKSMVREIRILNTTGIAGHVFTTGEPMVVHDAYDNKFFNQRVDQQTGFKTRNILCAPIRMPTGQVIGVAQMLNKHRGHFDKADLEILGAMTSQAAFALKTFQLIEDMEKKRAQEMDFLSVVSELSAEINLGPLLQKIMASVTKMLDAERATLFLNDEKTKQLWSELGTGLGATQIRFPNHLGIAGAVFTSQKTVNIPYAYADLRFNPAFDKQTGFFTRSILCVPVINKEGKCIGVTQVLNKRGGAFTSEDETRLKAFTAQVSIGLENAKLFDSVQAIKNYNEAMLQSMSNGVVTTDEDGFIATCNAAGLRILKTQADNLLGKRAEEVFVGPNAWIMERLNSAHSSNETGLAMDAELIVGEEAEKVSANLTFQNLTSMDDQDIGSMMIIEDISSEKRMKSTMSRYMDPGLAEKLLKQGEEILGGQQGEAAVLFSDIRSFTTLTEQLGAQGTVSLLNEYFTIMVDCIQRENGMLDKFIGDAIMAVFGVPIPHEHDSDRALRSAIAMMTGLGKFNRRRHENGLMPINIGIGINTDSIVSGNIGSPKRMDYTVIGDGVNLASRLESACKQYNAKILISEFTFRRLSGTYRLREVDKVVVKGKTEPVGILECLDYHTEETFPNVMEALGYFKAGLDAYRKAKWDAGIKNFREALALNPADKLCEIYIERCEHLKIEPPQGEWDGVWVMKSK